MSQEIDEREWLAQQLAMSREHWAPGPEEGDARDWSYRMIARALRQRPAPGLPPKFAEHMAARARAAGTTRFESFLLSVLVLVLAACAAAVLVRGGSSWTVDSRATGWMLAFAGCVGGSWLMEQWRRRAR